ncbi:acylphosphatase [Desulfogranum mediterraneum]|uniref:acylphosphatase n=1 Tax=Desulfogranum mediterraneum TaxID=160661 RepID=UPI000420FDE5|nr:acylphosphatase [Desulfogranum mediterraneum]
MGRTRLMVEVWGRVQGVWFRESCRQEALQLGVSGWVRNCPDGRVEALLEGDEQQLAGMVNWLHRGPPLARVDRVVTRQLPGPGREPTFFIK